jgi:DHA3 family multidrug efflux protein-like MFS transporter
MVGLLGVLLHMAKQQQAPAETKKDAPLAPKDSLRAFYHILVNGLIGSILTYTVWFAIVFFAYLETQSVFATGIISGLYLVATATTGIWFGSIVDHHRKKAVMLLSSLGSLLAFAAAFILYITAEPGAFKDIGGFHFWALVLLTMAGVIVANLRNIALPTLVTLLIPADNRDKANGLVGTVSGIGMLVTSVFSGILVGWNGMLGVLIIAVIGMAAVIAHLCFIPLREEKIVHSADAPKKIDLKGTWKIVAGISGLFALILFTTFNNFLGGVFMTLLDPYGLSLMSVQAWGILFGFVSLGFIAGGILIAKKGLGKNPLRTLLMMNVVLWIICFFFTIQPWIPLLVMGMFAYMTLMPYIEASEQTILQRVVPYERQGRVFGFAQSIEQAASPLTAFFIAPIAQFIFIPFMQPGGAGANAIGSWFGTGTGRGIALVFIITAVIGLIATLIAFASKQYRQLSDHYANAKVNDDVPQHQNAV